MSDLACPYCAKDAASTWGSGAWSVHCDDCCRRMLARYPSRHHAYRAVEAVIVKYRGLAVVRALARPVAVPF